MLTQEIPNQQATTPASTPELGGIVEHSALSRVWIPYKYLNLWEKIFLVINMLVAGYYLIYLLQQIVPVMQGARFRFGTIDWLLMTTVGQSISALRYKGLRQMPADEMDNKLRNQLFKSEKFRSIYNLKSSIFLWILCIILVVLFVDFLMTP